MIVEYIRYRIDPAKDAAFASAYEVASASLRASTHCLGYELARCTEARESYTLRVIAIRGFKPPPPIPQ